MQEKQRKISLFFCILSMKQANQKKEERNIEKEIQNQPPYFGGVQFQIPAVFLKIWNGKAAAGEGLGENRGQL